MFEDKSFTTEALLSQHGNSILNFLSLIGLKSIRTNQKGGVPNHQDDGCRSQHPRYPFEKTSFLRGSTYFGLCLHRLRAFIIGQRRSAAPARFVRAGVD